MRHQNGKWFKISKIVNFVSYMESIWEKATAYTFGPVVLGKVGGIMN